MSVSPALTSRGRDSAAYFDRDTDVGALPAMPKGGDAATQRWMRGVHEILSARLGTSASLADQVPTWRDLYQSGIVTVNGTGAELADGQSQFGLPPVEALPPAKTPGPIPPAPINFVVDPGLMTNILSWGIPAGREADVGYTEIYAYGGDDFSHKVLIGTTTALVYADSIGATGVARYYWIRFIGVGDIPQPGPFFSTASVEATTGKIGNIDLGDLIIEARNIQNGSLGPIKFIPGADNILPDPGFYDFSWWGFTGRPDFRAYDGVTPVLRYLEIDAGGGPFDITAPQIQIEQGGWYRVRVRYNLSVDFAGTFMVALLFPNVEWNAGGVPLEPDGLGYLEWHLPALTRGSWQTSDHQTIASDPGCTYTNVRITGNVTAGNVQIALEVQRATSADLLVAGSVVAGKVAADAIGAYNIIAGSITGDRVQAGTLTAVNVMVGTLTGDRLAANTITATNIQARTIQAYLIATNTLTANEIMARTITAQQIATNTLTAEEITVGAQGKVPNVLQNSDFTEYLGSDGPAPTADGILRFWTAFMSATGMLVGRNFSGGGTWNVGVGGAWLYDNVPMGLGQYIQIGQAFVAVAGVTYEAHFLGAALSCQAWLRIAWKDGMGAVTYSTPDVFDAGNGRVGDAPFNIDQQNLWWISATAPTGTVSAELQIIKYSTNPGSTDGYLFINRTWCAPKPAGATRLNPTMWRDNAVTTIDGHGITTESVTADKISIATLSELTANAGIIVSGTLRNLSNTAAINLDATGSADFIRVGNYVTQYDGSLNPNIALRADGSAYFSREVISKPKRIAYGTYALPTDYRPRIQFYDVAYTGSPDTIYAAHMSDHEHTIVALLKSDSGGSGGGDAGGGDGGGE